MTQFLLLAGLTNTDVLILPFRYGYESCKATADWLLAQTSVHPLVGIVCGSGLGGLADMLKDQKVVQYSDIPNFPQSTGEVPHTSVLE